MMMMILDFILVGLSSHIILDVSVLCFVLCLCAPLKNIKIFNIINARIVAVALPTVVLLITRGIVLPFSC
jgi:hypothetical protein